MRTRVALLVIAIFILGILLGTIGVVPAAYDFARSGDIGLAWDDIREGLYVLKVIVGALP